jgi:hypothetical protein
MVDNPTLIIKLILYSQTPKNIEVFASATMAKKKAAKKAKSKKR